MELPKDKRPDENGDLISVEEAVRRYGPTAAYPSEAAKCLAFLMPYLKGNLLDLGSGGWPVLGHAIQVELPKEEFAKYTGGRQEQFAVQWHGDALNLPFKNGVVDTCFSSHLLEDIEYERWTWVLTEWSRVLRRGGNLVILTPDKQRWDDYVARGNIPNCAHRHEPRFGEVGACGKSIGLILKEERFCMPYPEHSVMTVFEMP